jgi:dinuclear metal center YbgI/SA1388 family protein
MKIVALTDALEALAPLSLQESYDNCGLLIGDGQSEISGILICLDVTEAILQQAIAEHCNLIIAHHPLLFSGLKKIRGFNALERTVISAIKHDISVYAIHTNLDNIADGVNKAIAEKLLLKNCRVLQTKRGYLKKLVTFVPQKYAEALRQSLFAAGGGAIGNYDFCSFNTDGTGTFRGNNETNPFVGERNSMHYEAETRIELIFPAWLEKNMITALLQNHPYEEVAYDIYPLDNMHQYIGAGLIGTLAESLNETAFLEFVKKQMQAHVIRHTALQGKAITTVALCGGSGSFLIAEALAAGADAFITSDVKYHQFFESDGRLLLMDIGHFETEQYTAGLLEGIIRQKFPNFAAPIKVGNQINPIKYFL